MGLLFPIFHRPSECCLDLFIVIPLTRTRVRLAFSRVRWSLTSSSFGSHESQLGERHTVRSGPRGRMGNGRRLCLKTTWIDLKSSRSPWLRPTSDRIRCEGSARLRTLKVAGLKGIHEALRDGVGQMFKFVALLLQPASVQKLK